MKDPMLHEVWRPVLGFEGLYEVSSYGRVRSLSRVRTTPDGQKFKIHGRVLKGGADRDGYRGVNLPRDGKYYPRKIHKLVLEAFDGLCPEGMETRHLNGMPFDNRLVNLAWGTRAENRRDIVRHRQGEFLMRR